MDETMVVVMKFSRNRMAVCSFSIGARFSNDAVISGTEGSLKVGLQYWTLVWVSRLLTKPLFKGLGLVLDRKASFLGLCLERIWILDQN